MPTYEYACGECGRSTEAYQSFTDDPLLECPHCGGALKRVFHSVGIMFKGSGFYSTDAKGSKGSKGSGNGQKKDKKETSDKSESKPATSEGSSTKASDPKP